MSKYKIPEDNLEGVLRLCETDEEKIAWLRQYAFGLRTRLDALQKAVRKIVWTNKADEVFIEDYD